MSNGREQAIAGARRIVIKLGSSIVTDGVAVDRQRIGAVAADLSRLHKQGYQVILVTSGARAAGLARLGLKALPSAIPEQQAAAAVGQINLMALYEEFFSDFGRHIGQVLLTASDIEDRTRYLNARHTFEHLLDHGIIPVVNENDSVVVDELKFGDNDNLAALVAGLVSADLLVILTDVDGLYSSDPRLGESELVDTVERIDDELLARAGGASGVGTGGMASKIAAARSASHRGIPTVIANGRRDEILTELIDKRLRVGTFFAGADSTISSRKHWIAYGMTLRGRLVLDEGAVKALVSKRGSLLSKGIVEVSGDFSSGDCVSCIGPDGREIARGLVAYDSKDCMKIKGVKSQDIKGILGYQLGDEVIHRDDLVILENGSGAPAR